MGKFEFSRKQLAVTIIYTYGAFESAVNVVNDPHVFLS